TANPPRARPRRAPLEPLSGTEAGAEGLTTGPRMIMLASAAENVMTALATTIRIILDAGIIFIVFIVLFLFVRSLKNPGGVFRPRPDKIITSVFPLVVTPCGSEALGARLRFQPSRCLGERPQIRHRAQSSNSYRHSR